MRAVKLLGMVAVLISACGGVSAVDQSSPSSQPTDDAHAGAAAAPTDLLPDGKLEVVDDIDHADGQYPPVPPGSSSFFWRGGLGNWFISSSDGSRTRDASVEDVVPPRGENTKAYHLEQAAPGTTVDLWAQLNHPEGTAVDLRSYSGIAFWARRTGTSAKLTVAFGANGQISTLESVPQQVVSVSESWTQLVIRFDDLKLNSTAVSSIDLVVDGRTEPIDLWVDDLALVCRSNCP
ncbi:MAG: hypothetical protein ABUL62_11640 [Myxococcales bacterium]